MQLKDIARRIFLRLVAFREERPDTRRQHSWSALQFSKDSQLVDTTIAYLANDKSRLLTISGTESDSVSKIDISHESLITAPSLIRTQIEVRRVDDDEEFLAGGAAIISMQDAVEQSRRILLVLTPRYLQSHWTRFEMLATQTLDSDATQRRTIPLLIEKVENLPLLLSMLTYVDLTRPENQDGGQDLLIRSLGNPSNNL